jgi:hypothetical protein
VDQAALADLILVTMPSREELIRRRNRDRTRARRHFDRHLELGEALAEWYRAIERLDPGRVSWELPPDGLPGETSRRATRSGNRLLDAVLAGLPAS